MDDIIFPFAASFTGADAVAYGLASAEPPSTAVEKVRSWEMVSASHDDCSIFPPKLHEGLHLRPHADQTLASPASPIRDPGESAMIGPCFHVRENGEKELGPNRRPLSALAKRMVGYWVEFLRFNFVIRCGGSVESVLGILSFATMACVAGVFFYMRRRHRRDKEFLLFLIQEKNQAWVLLHLFVFCVILFLPVFLYSF
ncbi:hypothetical protein HPP92_012941 [Vanilla planifolia]|uniref:Uncharacterized protein n=1 Tax=Vanilla planifolia TaxID=51239 RepID=A0A835UY11_VANPL|nr:hypothetical protein HPP92_012941 [Vanilla planifolia]